MSDKAYINFGKFLFFVFVVLAGYAVLTASGLI